MASEIEVISVYHKVSANWPWANMTKATLAVWVEVLADTDNAAMQAAVTAILAESGQWPPTAGIIRTRALDLAAGPESAWEDAWNAIFDHAKECRAPEFRCPHDWTEIIGNDGAVALHMVGGYYNLMRTDVSTHPTIRAQFRDTYRGRTARAQAASRQPAAVTALLDASKPAQITPAPVRIGDGTTVSMHPPDTIRPAPQDWHNDAGSRRAELDAIIRRAGRGGL